MNSENQHSYLVEDLTSRVEKLESRISALENLMKPKYRVCPKCGSDLVVNTKRALLCYPLKYYIFCSKHPKCDYTDFINSSQFPLIKYHKDTD